MLTLTPCPQSTPTEAKRHKNDSDHGRNNPFALDPEIIDEHKEHDEEEDDEHSKQRMEINSHFRTIGAEFHNLRESMKSLQSKIKSESHLCAVRQKKEHNERLQRLQDLSRRKKV